MYTYKYTKTTYKLLVLISKKIKHGTVQKQRHHSWDEWKNR